MDYYYKAIHVHYNPVREADISIPTHILKHVLTRMSTCHNYRLTII